MSEKNPTPRTDEIIGYLAREFPATVGHIPIRERIEPLERELSAYSEVAKFFADYARHHPGCAGRAGHNYYIDIDKCDCGLMLKLAKLEALENKEGE